MALKALVIPQNPEYLGLVVRPVGHCAGCAGTEPPMDHRFLIAWKVPSQPAAPFNDSDIQVVRGDYGIVRATVGDGEARLAMVLALAP